VNACVSSVATSVRGGTVLGSVSRHKHRFVGGAAQAAVELNASAVDLNFAGIQVQILKREVLAGAVRGQFSFELRLTAVTVGLHRIMHIRFFDSNFRVIYMDVCVTTARAFHQQSHNIGIEPLQWAGCPGERMARLVPTRAAIWANPKAI
jgi:hypothetical protein